MTDEYQIDNVTWAEKDGNGNIVVDPDVVNTDKLSTSRTWQVVTNSRSFNDPETNNSGSEIKAHMQANVSSDGTSVVLSGRVAGTEVGRVSETFDNSHEPVLNLGPIPDDATYEIAAFGDTGSYSLDTWREFRL